MEPSHPEPMIIPPASGTHKQTFVLLHGRGDNGNDFAAFLLMTSIPRFSGLQSAFPDAKFIFPTASRRRAYMLNNHEMNQYFDIFSLRDPDKRDEIQFKGLRESSVYIHNLLGAAIDEVGAENVVLWGLSQGCAIALISLLTWNGPPFAATVGMCGWLPLRRRMIERMSVTPVDDGVESGADADDPAMKAVRLRAAVSCLHELLESPPDLSRNRKLPARDIPVFLGHGVLDPQVLVDLGRQACSFLISVGLDVQWSEYEDLGHWYSGPMLRDIILFLRERLSMAPSQQ